MKPETLETKLLKRIERKRSDVFLREDFADLGGYDQVGRVLRKLVRDRNLIRVGQGIYTRVSISPFTGRAVPVEGLATLREALKRVGIGVFPSRLQEANDAGLTTQVPTGRVVGVTRRVRRKLGYNGIYLGFENVGPKSR